MVDKKSEAKNQDEENDGSDEGEAGRDDPVSEKTEDENDGGDEEESDVEGEDEDDEDEDEDETDVEDEEYRDQVGSTPKAASPAGARQAEGPEEGSNWLYISLVLLLVSGAYFLLRADDQPTTPSTPPPRTKLSPTATARTTATAGASASAGPSPSTATSAELETDAGAEAEQDAGPAASTESSAEPKAPRKLRRPKATPPPDIYD